VPARPDALSDNFADAPPLWSEIREAKPEQGKEKPRTRETRVNWRANNMNRLMPVLLFLAIIVGIAGCACRPGYVGPYGAAPPRCWVW
jgi:hypothetical protein